MVEIVNGRCRICNSEKLFFLLEKNNFRIDKCAHCGLVQVRNAPSKEEIVAIYDKEFFDIHYTNWQNDQNKIRDEYSKFDYRLREIERKVEKRGIILDVGCSFGFFLDVARGRGWQTYGVEVSDFAAQYAMKELGLEVIKTPLTESNLRKKFFDVVTMWNVIEHLENPCENVDYIHKILKDNGLLVLTTGNVESYVAKIQRKNWRMFMPPTHLFHFSPKSINYLLKKCGFNVIEESTVLPYEVLLEKFKLINLVKKLKVSDKMLIYARKI